MRSLLTIILLTISSIVLFAQNEELPTDIRLPGWGLNEISGQFCGACMDIDPSQLVSTGGSQTISTKVTKIQSLTELRKSLKLDASASLGWGIFSSNMSASSFLNNKVTTFNQYLLIETTVLFPPEIIPGNLNKLNAYGEQQVRNGLKSFINSCGTKYVVGRRKGGKFYAVLEFSSFSESDFSQTSAKLSATVGSYASFEGSLKTQIESCTENSSLKMTIFKQGGEASISTDINTLLTQSQEFVAQVRNNPSVISLLVQSYDGVQGYPSNFDNNKIGEVKRRLTVIGGYLEACHTFSGDLAYIRMVPGIFPSTTVSDQYDHYWNMNENNVASYLSYAERLRDSFLSNTDINFDNFHLPSPPTFPTLERVNDWVLPKAPTFVKQHKKVLNTPDRNNVDCGNCCHPFGDKYGDCWDFTFKVDNNRNYLKNEIIVCISGACGWNGGNIAAAHWSYLPNKKEANVTFSTGSGPTTYHILIDEYQDVVTAPHVIE